MPADHSPISPTKLAFHPRVSPARPWPCRYTVSAMAFPGLDATVGTVREPSSATMPYMVPSTPLYFPTGTTVWRDSSLGSNADTYSRAERTETCARRRTVSRGRRMKSATVAEQNFVTEKATGVASQSSLRRDWSTMGVETVRIGWTREWSIVGSASFEGHRREGKDLSADHIPLDRRAEGVIRNLVDC